MKTKEITKTHQRGFSLIELLFAGAIFSVFASGLVEVILFGLESDRLGEETTIAAEYASEGMDALHSIKAKNFDGLSLAATAGIARENGEWILSGDENTFGKYTRVIAIEEVNRDGNGNIDEGGGNTDADTKKVIVTVSWNVTPARSDSVVWETFFTRWK